MDFWENCKGLQSGLQSWSRWGSRISKIYSSRLELWNSATMALSSISKGLHLDWSENNGLYDRFKKWKCKTSFLADGMKLMKESNDLCHHCIKDLLEKWVRDTNTMQGWMMKTAKSLTKYCKYLSHSANHISMSVAVVKYKQLAQGGLTLPHFI